jgi:hypothetical protein
MHILTESEVRNLPSKHYADPLDEPVRGPKNTHGVHPSPDAIGGYYGIGWYEYFRDRNTGELYHVHCSDGVNGGKGAYSDKDEQWRERCFKSIKERTLIEADHGVEVIRLTRNEWVVTLGFTRHNWLDEGDDPVVDSTDDGTVVGHIKGLPVVIDNVYDELPYPR